MVKFISIIAGCLFMVTGSFAQITTNQKLQKAFQQFEADSQLKHAISSLYVINAKTGEVVFDKNSQVGLAPASTQKIITAATAFELLGKDFRYNTSLFFMTNGFRNNIEQTIIIVNGSGDPTLGSPRYSVTSGSVIINKWINAIKKKMKNRVLEGIRLDDINTGDISSVPGGYIWDDIGNYYGAGSSWINWRENQYDISFKSGNTTYPADIISVEPDQEQVNFRSLVRAGEKGSGDNAYIYCPPYGKEAVIKGTIPPDQKKFTISGAMPDPAFTLGITLRNELLLHSIKIDSTVFTLRTKDVNDGFIPPYEYIDESVHYSPSLDSIIYWFLKKSINLYGEALIKTFAYEKKGFGSTDSGVVIVKDFWKQKGIDENELNISDGSGLSPQNRVTTHAQVEILKYAKAKDWFPYFYNALPEYNGMKMKSGSIKDVKAYCGYQKAGDGNEYIFSFLVNNFNGASSTVVNKMYKVLDVLK
jgi:serine-type D-Ala-D-Ala carboxypeptidase/endopeptidase (penicillin-binding protein 4)